MDGDNRDPMEGGSVLVVRASNLQEELQREAVYVEVAHEDTTTGGGFSFNGVLEKKVALKSARIVSVEPRNALAFWMRSGSAGVQQGSP